MRCGSGNGEVQWQRKLFWVWAMKSECVYGCHCVAAEHGVRTMACGHGVCGECLQLLVGRARGERVAECRGDSGAVSV